MLRVFFFCAFLGFSIVAAGADLVVVGIESSDVMLAESREEPPAVGDILALKSKSAKIGIIGFAEVLEVMPRERGFAIVRARLLRLTANSLVQNGDELGTVSLHSARNDYPGHTELLIREDKRDVSSRYRPLYTQGVSIGETAHTLSKNESIISMWGQFSYGLAERLSVGTFLPGLLLSSPNVNAKGRIYESSGNTVAIGTTVTKIRDSASTAVNLSFFWDSVTSTSMTTHTLVTMALATLEQVEDTVAIKTAGTSSLQTGYEVLLGDWDRVLFGPSYNFETKAIGGYLSYMRVWDHLHFSATISTVNVREFKYAPQTGYVGLVEAYWRY